MKIGVVILLVGFALWLAQTWYFGWSWKPSCDTERILDTLTLSVIALGVGIVLAAGTKMAAARKDQA